MADNTQQAQPSGSARLTATDQVTHSGDVADVQLVRIVGVAGAEGSRVVVSPDTLISTLNSSAAALAANAIFDGVSEDVSEYADISVAVYSSHQSAANGLQLLSSMDGVNWDLVDTYAVPAVTGKTYSLAVRPKFFRVSYTNGSTAQTAFRLQIIYSKHYKKGSSVRPQDGRSNDNDFEEALDYGMAYDAGADTWHRVRSSIANGLLTDVSRIVAPLPAGTNSIGTVVAPTLTKGTQGATGFSTQDLKDAGRVMVTFTATALAGVTTETLINLTPYRDLVAGTAATTHAVTSGKRLRLQTVSLTLRSTSTVNVGAIVRFRMLAGAVLVGSPVHNSVGGMSSNIATAVIGNANSYTLTFPEGFELSGTMQFGLTQLASATSATLDIHVTGYEY